MGRGINISACIESFGIGPASVFICYAHSDNSSTDPRLRWLDRLLEFLRPLIRNEDVTAWSDKQIEVGASWHERIQNEVNSAKVAVLLISPAFLASDYIARSEVPVLLKFAKDRGLKVMPVIVSPCLFEETRFKYPDWKLGPHELLLGSLQSINSPSRTLIEMTEGEQNRVLLSVARQLASWLNEDKVRAAEKMRLASLEAEAAKQRRLERMAREIDDAPVLEGNGHVIVQGICSVCGNSAEAIAHFKWFSCTGTTTSAS